jgi:hypothetical protein
MIKVADLKPGYSMFGNKGSVWANRVHISQDNSFAGVTLCNTPMLSSNHARIEGVKEVGCPDCITMYKALTDRNLNLPERKKYLGSGTYMKLQPWTQNPQIGDWFQDADLGEMIWDGKQWVND